MVRVATLADVPHTFIVWALSRDAAKFFGADEPCSITVDAADVDALLFDIQDAGLRVEVVR